MAVGTGLQVMAAMMDDDVDGACAGRRAAMTRTGTRCGTAARTARSPSAGGGCRCAGRGCAPRTGRGELPVPSYELFASTELLGRMAMERMLAKLSTRRYPVGLEPVGAAGRAGRACDVEVGGVAAASSRHRDAPWPSCSPPTCPGWTWWR